MGKGCGGGDLSSPTPCSGDAGAFAAQPSGIAMTAQDIASLAAFPSLGQVCCFSMLRNYEFFPIGQAAAVPFTTSLACHRL